MNHKNIEENAIKDSADMPPVYILERDGELNVDCEPYHDRSVLYHPASSCYTAEEVEHLLRVLEFYADIWSISDKAEEALASFKRKTQ